MGTRADNQDGSLREILSGKHRGKWRVQFTQVDELGKKQRLSRLFPTKGEGREFLKGLRHGVKAEAARQKQELTLGGWFDFLAESEWPEELSPVTIAARKGRFDRYVRSVWGAVPLMKVDPLKVRTFYRSLEAGGVGKATVLEIKRDLVRTFNQARTPYMRVPVMAGNPFALTVKAPEPRKAVALTPEEARKAIQCKKLSPKERAMLGTFLLAGVRLSEQMALTKGQIRFGEGLINVDRAVKFDPKRKQHVGLPKGDKVRTAVLCPALRAILEEVTADLGPDDYVWPADDGNRPRLKRNVYRTWKAIVEKAGLPAEMSPHDCRLTHINWIEKLMPAVSATTLKEHVGHSGEGVTEVNYTRALSSAQLILAESIEGVVFGKARAKPGNRARRVSKQRDA